MKDWKAVGFSILNKEQYRLTRFYNLVSKKLKEWFYAKKDEISIIKQDLRRD